VTEADQRFGLLFVAAASIHVLVLLGIVIPASAPGAASKLLTVTLSLTPDDSNGEKTADIIADADQSGPDATSYHSRTASWTVGESITADRFGHTPGMGADAADTPLLARRNEDAERRSGSGRHQSDGRAGDAATPGPESVLRRTAVADPRAAYLEKWRRTVERTGSRTFPHAALAGERNERRLTLEVTLSADGRLLATRVLRSSGKPQLDAASQRILRGMAPFEPFPAELRERWSRLTFAYDWRFLPGRGDSVNLGVR
jgi:TonB family protein